MNPDAVLQTIRLFSITSFYTIVAYGVCLLAGASLWIAYRSLWRQRGGLFVAGVLLLLYVPVELVQMYYDIKLVMLVQDGSLVLQTLDNAKQILLKRLSVLSGVPLLAVMGYFTAIFFLVAQPLRKAESHEQAAEQAAVS
jgi:hypothetical protein